MSDCFEGVPRSIMCWAMILTSLWLEVRMSNSRASLASDYLDNFYASLPPRFSCQHVLFWIFAQFYFPPRLSTCLIFWIFAQFYFQADKWRACQAAPAFILQTNAKNKLKVPPWLLFCIAYFPFPTALAFFVSQSLCAVIFLALLLILVLFTFLATPFALLIFAPTAFQFFFHYNAFLDFFSILVTSAVCVCKRKVVIFYFPCNH